MAAEQDVTTTGIPVGPVERGLVFFVMCVSHGSPIREA